MAKRSSYEIRNEILMILKEESLPYTKIERKLDTNYNTVKMHCEELEKDGFVKIETNDHDPSNGRKSYKISITSQGRKRLEKS